jgi:Transglycosylase SLT domain
MPPVPPSGQSVLDQLEGTADYYGPSTYADRLTFFSSYERAFDPTLDFLPVTGAAKNPKLFAVGLIPPIANVSGRILDRSASVAAAGAPSGQVIDPSGAPGRGFSGSAFLYAPGQTPPLSSDFWVSFVAMSNRLGVDPKNLAAVIHTESGFRSDSQNFANGKDKPAVAKGLNQLIKPTANGLGMTDEEWAVYERETPEQQLKWVEKYFAGANIRGKSAVQIYAKNFGSYNNPDGSMYAGKAAQIAWLQANGFPTDDATRKAKFTNADYQQKTIEQNAGLVGSDGTIRLEALQRFVAGQPPPSILAQIEAAQAAFAGGVRPGTTRDPFAPSSGETTVAGWQTTGSANAATSQRGLDKAQTTDLNATNLGLAYFAAQSAEIAQTIALLEAMKSTPPLRLLVNPSTFKVTSEKVVSNGNWTRNGPIVELWGDGQDKLEFSGKIAAFFAIDTNSPSGEVGGPGLTRVSRNYSASYQNFLSLWHLYRNNAHVYLSDGKHSRLSLVGSVYIYYDDTLYVGSFDTFNVTEVDTSPYTLEYSVQFTVRATFALDRPFTQAPPAPGRIPTSSGPSRTDNRTDVGPNVLLADEARRLA